MYLNPYYLLEKILGESPPREGELLAEAIQKGLLEFGFEADPILDIAGVGLHRSEAKAAFAELEIPEKRDFHWQVYQHRELHDLLFTGRAELNQLKKALLAAETCGSDIRSQLSPYIARVMGEAYHGAYLADTRKAKDLLGLPVPVLADHEDICYGSLYGAVRQDVGTLLAELEKIYSPKAKQLHGLSNLDMRRRRQKVREMRKKQLAAIESRVPLLNALPAYFQSIRNETGQALEELASKLSKRPVMWGPCRRLILCAGNIHLDGEVGRSVSANVRRVRKATTSKKPVRETPENNMGLMFVGGVVGLCMAISLGLFEGCEKTRPPTYNKPYQFNIPDAMWQGGKPPPKKSMNKTDRDNDTIE